METGTVTVDAPAERIDVAMIDLSNNALIVRLHYTINHLSRWLTPIHDQRRFERTIRRGEPTVRELVARLRDEELRVFPMMHAIAVQTLPDLDKLPPAIRTADEEWLLREASTIQVMASFRRLRQSTCSLLRGLPDTAWERSGRSRRDRNWTLRQLAEHLATHDLETLFEMDLALDRVGAREGIAAASRAHLSELLKLAPSDRR